MPKDPTTPKVPDSVDPATGVWTPTPRALPEPEESAYPTLGDWMDRYPVAREGMPDNPHPWVHLVKAVPMGENGETPMNHSLQVLNLIAIHLERVGFEAPNPDKTQIHYQSPMEGPDVVWNPGTWPTLDVEIVPRPDAEGISLEGVPADQLDILIQAAQDEKMRLAKIQGADPEAKADAVASVTPATVVVQPVAEEPTE